MSLTCVSEKFCIYFYISMAKLGFRNYKKPRPLILKIIGDTLLGTFGSAGIGAAVADYKWLGIAFFGLALLGHFFTNLYASIDQAYYQEETTTITKKTKIETEIVAEDEDDDKTNDGVIH